MLLTSSVLCNVPLSLHQLSDQPGEGELASELLLSHGNLLPTHHVLVAQSLHCSLTTEYLQPELCKWCVRCLGLEETQVAVVVKEGNNLGKYWDNDIIKFSSEHVLEGASCLKVARVHGLIEDPVGVLEDTFPLPQNAVDVGDEDTVE